MKSHTPNHKQVLTRTVFLLGALTLFHAPQLQAERSKGGGHVVIVDGKRRLLDLVDRYACTLLTGDEILRRVPKTLEILSKIEKLDWYLAFDMKRQIQLMEWCMTRELVGLNPNDQDSVNRAGHRLVEQAAIRPLTGSDQGTVYMDQDLLGSLPELDQAYLILRELGHSYLDLNTPRRRSRLRQLTLVWRDVVEGRLNSRAQLGIRLDQNRFVFGGDTRLLDEEREVLTYALGTRSDREAVLVSHPNLEDFFGRIRSISSLTYEGLIPQDRALLASFDPYQDLSDLVESGEESFIEAMTNSDRRHALPILYSIAGSPRLSSVRRTKLWTSPAYSTIATSFYKMIAEAIPSIEESRIVVPQFFRTFGDSGHANCGNFLIVQQLLTLSEFSQLELHPIAEGYLQYVIYLISSGAESEWKQYVTGNEEFYAALSFQNQLQALETLTPPVPRERGYATQALKAVRGAFWTRALKRIQSSVPKVEWEKFDAALDRERLGI